MTEFLERPAADPGWQEPAWSDPGAPEATKSWHVLWTRSNFEQLVGDGLWCKGYEVFLPRLRRWVRKRGERTMQQVPMFPGYLFLRHAVDKDSYLDICKTRGLVRILGERWDRLATVPDSEIDAIRRSVLTSMPVMPHPWLQDGRWVRVVRGPLVGAQGILARCDRETGLLVLSIRMLRRSVAVEVDSLDVAAA